MEPRERVVEQLRHRQTDVIPYVVPVEQEVAERLDRHYGGAGWREAKCDHIVGVHVADMIGFGSREGTHVRDPFGSQWRLDRRPWHLERPALAEPDLGDYAFPDVDELFRDDWLEDGRRQCEQQRGRGRFVIAVLGFCLFERTWALRGFENALMDMAMRRPFYEELLERITLFDLEVLDRLLQLPVDGIQTGDDWGDQRGLIMGKDRWMELFLPRYERLWGKVKEAGLFTIHHSCGNVSQIVAEAADAGLDCFESVQPEAMDPYELKQRHGGRMAFWGGAGTQRLLPRGTPEEIRAEVARLCREMGRDGGYILAPAKPLMPEVPTENAVAFLEAVLEQAGQPVPPA